MIDGKKTQTVLMIMHPWAVACVAVSVPVPVGSPHPREGSIEAKGPTPSRPKNPKNDACGRALCTAQEKRDLCNAVSPNLSKMHCQGSK